MLFGKLSGSWVRDTGERGPDLIWKYILQLLSNVNFLCTAMFSLSGDVEER